MDTLWHDDISHHYETVSLPRLFENGEKPVARPLRVQKRQAPITRTGDKVQVMRAVGSMQAAGHEQSMVSAASYPPLQKSQERGTHGFKTGNEIKIKGRATRLSSLCVGINGGTPPVADSGDR